MSWAWAAWGLSFVVLESIAFLTRGDTERIDTLSRNIQWLFTERGKKLKRTSLIGWFIFSAWFAFHIW